jgi:hypothetical protein
MSREEGTRKSCPHSPSRRADDTIEATREVNEGQGEREREEPN